MAIKGPGGPVALDDTGDEVAIVGVGESQHSTASGRSTQDMAFTAIDAALADAGLSADAIDGLMITGGMSGQITPDRYRAHYGTTGDLWWSNEGGAFSFAATAPHTAALGMRAGTAKRVLNVFAIDWASQMKAQTGGPATYHRDEIVKANAEVPFGFIPQPVYFAAIARRHMHQYGTRPEQLGAIAVAQRRHANGHPGAVMKDKALTLEKYMARAPFIEPLRTDDCCLISDGAGAYIMAPATEARDFPQPPVIVAGVGYGRSLAGTYFALEPEFISTPLRFSAPGAYAMAKIDVRDVDVLACYDPFTIASLIMIEDLGFCAKGDGGGFVEGDRLAHDRGRACGGIPYNTHGGLLSHAYVLGIAHVIEVVRQLRGTAANQVRDARFGVYGGYTGVDAATLVLRSGDA